MKRSSFTICLGLSVGVAMSVLLLGQTDDPFAIKPGPPPVRDAAYYAKQTKEDAENWRAYLKHRGVPDLETLKGDKGTEIFRFIYVPCFHQHLLLTARTENGKATLEILRFSEKGQLELSGAMEIDNDIMLVLRREFAKPEIRDPLRGLTDSQREALPGLDGATWHLETLRNGKYTHAAVWSPDSFISNDLKAKAEMRAIFKKEYTIDLPDFRPFVETCLELVRLSGLPLDAKYYEPVLRSNR